MTVNTDRRASNSYGEPSQLHDSYFVAHTRVQNRGTRANAAVRDRASISAHLPTLSTCGLLMSAGGPKGKGALRGPSSLPSVVLFLAPQGDVTGQ